MPDEHRQDQDQRGISFHVEARAEGTLVRASPRQPPIEAIEQCHDGDETGCEPRAAIARRLADQSGDTCHECYPQ